MRVPGIPNMYILLALLFIGLTTGQLGAFSLAQGVTFYSHDILLGLIVCVGIVRVFSKRIFVRPALFIPICSFVFVGVISLLVNAYRFEQKQIAQASLYLLRWAAYASLYIVLVQRFVSPAFLFYGLYGLGTGISLLGLVQLLTYPDLRNLAYLGWDPHYYRLFSTLFDPNYAGVLIGLTVFLGILLMTGKKRPWLVWLQVINCVALYLTYSRSTYLAFAAGILIIALLLRRYNVLFLLIAFIVILFLVPTPGGKTLRLGRLDSTVARVSNWIESGRLFARSPIIGHGFNTLRFVGDRRSVPPAGEPISHAGAGVDSSILFLLSTVGLLGAGIYGWLFYSLFMLLPGKKEHESIRAVWMSMIVLVLVHSLFINSLFYPWVMIWLWITASALEVVARSKNYRL